MSVSNVHSRDDAESAQPLIRAQQLLEEALQLIDAHASAAHLGARIQEVIEELSSRAK